MPPVCLAGFYFDRVVSEEQKETYAWILTWEEMIMEHFTAAIEGRGDWIWF